MVVPVARLMRRVRSADTSNMALFPDEFPFNKRDVEAPVEPASAPAAAVEIPLVKVGPIHDDVPVAAAPVAAPVVVAPVSHPEAVTPAEAQAMAAAAAVAPAPAVPPSAKDRRRSPRQRLMARATLRIDNTGGNPLQVEIDNFSLLGIRFKASRELLIGDKANIRLEVGPLKWATRLRVINCIETDEANTYAVGCEFVGNELARPYTVAA